MRSLLTLFFAIPCLWGASVSQAELKPEMVHVADSKKNLAYVRDGLYVGGDRAINHVSVRDIRYARNAGSQGGYERIVIDLQGTQDGEPAAVPRPPYYQVAVNPDERRLVVTLWGKPRLEFDPLKIKAAFKKSSAIQAVSLLPRVEDDSWTFVFELKDESPVEVFELSNPVRIIIDLKTLKKSSVFAQPSETKAKPKLRAKAKPKASAPNKPAVVLPPESTRPPIPLDPELEEKPEDHG
ncbi:hypothetical protein WDW37_07920 [Bdellovibrionota bacterium FG-1]